MDGLSNPPRPDRCARTIGQGRYAGPTGWVDARGNGAFAVSVRSAQLDGTTATLRAGVGIVADSDPLLELEETRTKARALLSILVRA
ncbi:MAG: chorismate-binding protein [Microthrixaceae bacterium]